ncbi:serine/threonine-protein kinase PknH/PknJ [Mycobacterium vicinigordonae]|uniref:non-specific serine/threonine protein kinase n=1 Tax=Mycobacterium vicinigordonae TaxID=1719132 RepID=A0A7D6E1C4_9MYCO|nr:serine/threonine-protein kinase PknH/PknJ [Mycobacterium vicinigordonae]QLL07441.1 sensor domain-containing protein [Mycobacterium vicinigordonae]
MLSPGSVVAGYRIERLLGSGGMGEVYQAAHPNLPRFDALKVLNAQLSQDPDFRVRFQREADVAARLDHPNIVSIYNRGQTEQGQLWIAMQFVDGTDADRALESGAMTPARTVHIVGEVARALDHAHRQGVVHRDVKPANFLLSGPVGPDERVLLGDFGIARALGDAGLTVTGSVVATLSYAAPELLSGEPFDGRADVYSLGCALFRLLTGKAPFAWAQGLPALVGAHLQAPPPRVTDWAPGLSPRLDAVIATAMAKDPAQRFASARELALAAADALTEQSASTTAPWQPISSNQVSQYPIPEQAWWQPGQDRTAAAPPMPPWPAPAPPPRRRRGRITAAALAAVAVSGAIAAVVALAVRTPSHPPTSAPSLQPTTTVASAPTTTTVSGPVPPVVASELPGFLLPAEQIKTIMGAAAMQVVESSADSWANASTYISDQDCIGPYQPADTAAYGNSGSTGSQRQFLTNPGGGADVQQAVIVFPSADAAQKSFAAQRAVWAACAGRTFTVTLPNQSPHRWSFGPLSTPDGGVALTTAREGQRYAGCERALAATNNVLVDVGACNMSTDKHGVAILEAILAKVPH